MYLDRKRKPLREAIESCSEMYKCSEKTGVSSAEPIVIPRKKLTGVDMIKSSKSEKIKPSPISVDSGKPGFDPFRIPPSKLQVPVMPQRLLFCAQYEFNMTMPYGYDAFYYILYRK